MTSPTDPPRPAGSTTGDPALDDRSPMTLASDVLRQSSTLVSQEVQLAKAEVAEGMTRLKAALGEIVAGAILIAVSLGILLSALVSGVARLLVALFGNEAPDAAGSVVVEGLDEQGTAIVTAMDRSVGAALDAARTLPAYEALAALIVGLVFAAIGGLLLKRGLDALDAKTVLPDRAVRQVRKDGEMVRDKT